MRKGLVTLLLLAATTGMAQTEQIVTAQVGPPKVAHYPAPKEKTGLERLAGQTFLITNEGQYGKTENFINIQEGTTFAFKREGKYVYFITNDHVVKPVPLVFKSERLEKSIDLTPKKMLYGIFDNGVEYGLKGRACVLYTDKTLDIAVLYGEIDGASITPVKPLRRKLRLGEQVYMIGYPKAALQTVVSGYVASRATLAKEGDKWPIPGYQVNILNDTGVSGSGIFVKEGEEFYWAGIAQATTGDGGTLQIVPVEMFYDMINSISPNGCCDENGTIVVPEEEPKQ
jgi:S1-C subfamily serine protease